MDLLDITPPNGLQGYSLAPDLLVHEEEKSNHPEWILSQFHSDHMNTGTFMVRMDDIKLIYYVGYPTQLFNITQDPYELNDLSNDEPEMLLKMMNLLMELIEPTEADEEAKKFDKETFLSWKESLGNNFNSTIAENISWSQYWSQSPEAYLELVEDWVKSPIDQ